ncbi:BQ5605_C001g00335 [Microbotryum silenes-dioicae]|uniref:cystathionine gamma-synthase n=1 Tax=Microbotryum silenes-dioicae TaxID=796604 RepID=A0A2X0P5K5_9BASI|nr:BQ5605_C001g00335 [Microbotryum silenes-dioicae]
MPGLNTSSYGVGPPPASPLGSVIPAHTPHAVSVSLPTWQDNVAYEEGEQRIKDAMTSGYPRFYIHHQIQQLADLAIAKFGQANEACILLPTARTAQGCVSFLASREPPVQSRVVEWPVAAAVSLPSDDDNDVDALAKRRTIHLQACFFDEAHFSIAKQYWQHTGDGISSRIAERCLILLGELEAEGAAHHHSRRQSQTSPLIASNGEASTSSSSLGTHSKSSAGRYGGKAGGGRYGVVKPSSTPTGTATPTALAAKLRYSIASRPRNGTYSDESEPALMTSSLDALPPREALAAADQDEDVLTRYVEERYGRNLDLSLAPLAKLAMRRRIAGVLRETPGQAIPVERIDKTPDGEESTRGVASLTERDVWLYPGGMSAIFHSHQLAMGAREKDGKPIGKSICFGFPYTDTLKILEKWGPGCEFFGRGLSEDLPALRQTLEKANPPILAIYCEFPSNPLLRTPPLTALRELADEFGCMVVVDETIAGFVNVEVLPLADIVVSSLTKVFSGDSNVMGGSLVLNPKSEQYASLKAVQEATYEDFYFDEDAIYMERNSRDFQQRIAQENYNAETLCEYLRSRRAPGPCPTGVIDPPEVSRTGGVIKEVYYPKYINPEHYTASLRTPSEPYASGFGALFSLTFTSLQASAAFFDALPCYKGPSLGTNFTLACPYTILAHYTETEWALKWGVEKGLVRVSVGLEDVDLLKQWFEQALDKAEQAEANAKKLSDSVSTIDE